jgi:hypothetical protein
LVPCPGANGFVDSASFKQLEALRVDLEAFPDVEFFRVEVGLMLACSTLLQQGSPSAAVHRRPATAAARDMQLQQEEWLHCQTFTTPDITDSL